MINSMTGFGSAEGTVGALRVSVEIRSVNHRFFNPAIKLPNRMAQWEGDVRETMRKRFSRGHVSLSVRVSGDTERALAIDEERVAAYVAQLRGMKDRLGLAGDVDVATVMRLPDVITSADADDTEVVGTVDELTAIVNDAANGLDLMRDAEGARIADFLNEHLAIIQTALARVKSRAPERLAEQQKRLQTAVAELARGVAVDPQRLAQEIAILADRMDVAEELNRFTAHIAAFRAALSDREAAGVGKRLGFLIQEMLREANTTGSKANDSQILGEVVAIKEELERLREQSENVE
ncbi:MAG: YicC family protein [Gemmatimonadota bacterium]|nr:YicC family protein [Gemmatimonadota bacterium]